MSPIQLPDERFSNNHLYSVIIKFRLFFLQISNTVLLGYNPSANIHIERRGKYFVVFAAKRTKKILHNPIFRDPPAVFSINSEANEIGNPLEVPIFASNIIEVFVRQCLQCLVQNWQCMYHQMLPYDIYLKPFTQLVYLPNVP